MAEIERLTKLMAHYERTNLDHIQTIETLNQTHDANVKRILELEKTKVQQTKTIKSLEGRMKFDKMAADGMKKKFDLLQVESRDLKAANEKLNEERTEYVARIEQLMADLNHNRSDKLKFMHENAKLTKENAELRQRESEAGKDVVAARTDLLDKIESLENALKTSNTFKQTVDAQSIDMLMSSHKIYDLQQQLIHTRQHVVELEAMSSEYNHTIDVLQHEVSRLRKELMDASIGVSGQSAAVLSRSGAANRSNRIATGILQASYAFDGDESAYALKRRPRTELGVSRARNKANSDGRYSPDSRRMGTHSSLLPLLEDGPGALHTSASAGTVLPALSHTSGQSTQAEAEGQRAPTQYVYRDLSDHQNPDRPTQKAPVVVDGGKVSIEQGVRPTVRQHLLQSYEGVVASPKRIARASNADSLLHAPYTPNLLAPSVDPIVAAQKERLLSTLLSTQSSVHSTSKGQDRAPSSGLLVNSRSDQDVFSACRPVATPFRPKSDSLSASLGSRAPVSPPASLKGLVDHIRDVYSASSSGAGSPLRASTDSGMPGAAKRKMLGGQLNARSVSPLTVVESTDPLGSTSSALGLQLPDGAEHNVHVTFGSSTELKSKLQHDQDKHKSKGGRGRHSDTASKRSLFVGTGLGLKHNAELDAELRKLNRGSTQHILRKILGDRFD